MKKKETPAGRPESRRPGPRPENEEGSIRLNRYLALNGIASRRRADRLIEEGEVMVDGEIVTELGRRVDPAAQRVEVDGVVLKPEGERKRYYLLNKPSGVLCTNEVRENRPRAVDLITDRKKGRIYTVGRLDEETVGLVLLTNDGDFAYRLSHPRFGIRKVYRVTIRGWLKDEDLAKLRAGVRLSDFRAHFDRVWMKKRSDSRTVLLLTLSEGRNREIRRVFARIGYPVQDLRRVEFGSLTERGLKVGHWRPLVRQEVEDLLRQVNEDAGAVPSESRERDARGAKARGRGSRARAGSARPRRTPR